MQSDREVENPLLSGDYYEQPKIYAVCDECGGIIYEGDYFHIVGNGAGIQKICEACCKREVAQCDH